MELFLPSLIILLLASLFSFFVVPRMGATVLVVVSILALIAAGVHHYSMFSSEYQLSTWQLGLQANAPWVVLGLAFLFLLAAMFYMFGGEGTKATIAQAAATPLATLQQASEASVAAMPSAASATNALTAALNRGLNAVAPGAPAPAAAAAPAPAPANNTRRVGGVPLSQI
jgi:hypothetical protein